MVAERLAAAGGHEGEDVAPSEESGDHTLLVHPKFLVAKDP